MQTFNIFLQTIANKMPCVFAVCSDIDECATNNGGCDTNAVCVNTVGSYFCYCKLGYHGDGIDCTGEAQAYNISALCIIFKNLQSLRMATVFRISHRPIQPM